MGEGGTRMAMIARCDAYTSVEGRWPAGGMRVSFDENEKGTLTPALSQNWVRENDIHTYANARRRLTASEMTPMTNIVRNTTARPVNREGLKKKPTTPIAMKNSGRR